MMATVARRTCQALRRVEKHAASRQSADCVEVLAALSSRLLLVGAWDSRSASAQNSQGLNPAALTSVAARGSPGSSADVARSGALLPSALWQPQRQRDSADEPSAVSPVSSTLRRGPRAAPALQLPTTTRGFCDTASRAGSSSAGSGPPTPSSGGLKPSATPAVTEPAEGYDETAGWSYDLINLPNSLSVARGLSGPLIASWIMQGNAEAALVGIAAAGASDWADGYLARQMKTSSVLGSYLDPLADKVLMGSVYVALMAKGLIPVWLVTFVIGRDVLLVGGSFIHRAQVMGWKWRGWREFFRLTPGSPGAAPSAVLVKPLLLSKVNTVLQLALVTAALTHIGWNQPGLEALESMVTVVAVTTVGTSAQYWVEYTRGRVFR